jgi:aconitate hydratase
VTASGRVLTVNHAFFRVDGLIFDGQYGFDDTVRVSGSGHAFQLLNAEVRRSTYDLIDIGAANGILIDHCLIHHALNAAGGRTDAHGIFAGALQDLTIRDTEIHTFSGDGVQVDPGRSAPGWNRVTIERAHIWLAPLPAPENGFPAGAVPGENAVDTKASASYPRATIVIDDLASVEPSVAGPRRPQDRVSLPFLPDNFRAAFPAAAPSATTREDLGRLTDEGGTTGATDNGSVAIQIDGSSAVVRHGSVAIAAITSCTNTSNPTVMVGAGLLARNAVARGLRVGPVVKTSLAPGSRAVTGYLEAAGLMDPLETLGFALAGYGCTTCIGNSGPLDDAVAGAIEANDLVVAAVLSGNRNFEGRIHPLARASYLASPPLVVAFALAGRVDIDLTTEPLGTGSDGRPVFLADIWPEPDEIRSVIASAIDPELFRRTYATVFDGDDAWRLLPIPSGDRYAWEDGSTYIAKPPFFEGLTLAPRPVGDIEGARVLAVLGDSVTTDHISPAGSIAPSSPAGQWLQAHGVGPLEFNSYGARRGHHEVMMRGTFANIRLRNRLVEGKEGPYTVHLPDGEEGFIYDVAMRYGAEGVPLAIIAGREYGSGSSRDWAAKGPALLGVRFALAESFERIHRSNLVGMGVLPLQFKPGESAASLGLTGREIYSVTGLADGLTPRQTVAVTAFGDPAAGGDGGQRRFDAIARLDGPIDVEYYLAGGILPTVLRRLATEN